MAEVSRGGDPGRLLFKVTSLSVNPNALTLALCDTPSPVGWDPSRCLHQTVFFILLSQDFSTQMLQMCLHTPAHQSLVSSYRLWFLPLDTMFNNGRLPDPSPREKRLQRSEHYKNNWQKWHKTTGSNFKLEIGTCGWIKWTHHLRNQFWIKCLKY